MECSGLALWAENTSERPLWVRGTWRVDGGVIRRVSDREEAPSAGFIVPGMVDTHCHIGYSETGSVSEAEMVEQARATLTSGVTVVRDCGVPVDNSPAARATGLHLIRCGRHVARPKRYMRTASSTRSSRPALTTLNTAAVSMRIRPARLPHAASR